MRTHPFGAAFLLAAGWLLAASVALAADQKQQIEGNTVVTILPEKEIPGGIPQDALHLKLDGKEAAVTSFTALRAPESRVEMVVLIDDGARFSLGTEMSEIAKFIATEGPDTKVAVGYMMNGRAALTTPLTTDYDAVERSLRLPMTGEPGISGSPYFCLSDLAKHWPSSDAHARREVVMITDGVDYYELHYDPEDPYVRAAMDDAVRARLTVYGIYWRSSGRFDRTLYAAADGQNLMAQLTEGTGGASYWEGIGNPVTLTPYFQDIDRRIDNQYELGFMTAAGSKPEMQSVKLTVSVQAKVDAPQEVYVHRGAE